MHYILLFFAGILTALPFVWQQFGILSWFSLIPLLYITQTRKGAYSYGFVFCAGYYGVLYYWFTCLYPMEFAGLDSTQSVAVIIISWVGMILLQSSGTALVPFFLSRVCRKKSVWYMPLVAASLWTIFEWAQTLTWLGVPWGRIALSQCGNPALIQSASLLGSLFISFIIVLTNAFITLGLLNVKHIKRLNLNFICATLVFLINFVYGTSSLNNYTYSGDSVKVALIQGNIASGDKWAENSFEFSLERYVSLAEKAYNEYHPDIIMMPETVIPVSLRYDDSIYTFAKLARDTKALILVGTYDTIYDEIKDEYDIYNSIVPIYPNSGPSDVIYYKRHLVPFGEYLPMEPFIRVVLPVMAELNVFKTSLSPGDGASLINTEYGEIGGLICFDSIYETLALDSVREGAELIVLATNDSWYRDSAAVYQHNNHAILRAVETGRFIIRAANTGISSIIKPTGEMAGHLPPLEMGNLYGEVRFITSRTPYSVVGNLIIPISFLLTLVFTFVSYAFEIRHFCFKRKTKNDITANNKLSN